jgi:AraC family transcriptional regulator, transcriptional activator of pobA
MSTTITIKEFYKDIFKDCCKEFDRFLDDDKNKHIGHFNVFNIKDLYKVCDAKPEMPYNRRTYYKISLIKGKNKVEYADRVIDIKDRAVLFASPKIPYRYTPQNNNQSGHFCVFTSDFLSKSSNGFGVEDVQIFKPNSDFIFELNEAQFREFESIFGKMHQEIKSDYPFKYDLLRNFVIELIHYGQKLKPVTATDTVINAAARIATLFVELLERQFPIESPTQVLQLKTAKHYADTLKVHVNHLNKVLKDITGKTTTEVIGSRITQEAKLLLRQTTWNVSEIAYSLGFEEVAHFSNFFKKQTAASPLAFREQLFEFYK